MDQQRLQGGVVLIALGAGLIWGWWSGYLTAFSEELIGRIRGGASVAAPASIAAPAAPSAGRSA